MSQIDVLYVWGGEGASLKEMVLVILGHHSDQMSEGSQVLKCLVVCSNPLLACLVFRNQEV